MAVDEYSRAEIERAEARVLEANRLKTRAEARARRRGEELVRAKAEVALLHKRLAEQQATDVNDFLHQASSELLLAELAARLRE